MINIGDKVTFSDKAIKENNLNAFTQKYVFIVKEVHNEEIVLNVGTVLYAGEWKILPKETPTHY